MTEQPTLPDAAEDNKDIIPEVIEEVRGTFIIPARAFNIIFKCNLACSLILHELCIVSIDKLVESPS